jgi:hypothetical protein
LIEKIDDMIAKIDDIIAKIHDLIIKWMAWLKKIDGMITRIDDTIEFFLHRAKIIAHNCNDYNWTNLIQCETTK